MVEDGQYKKALQSLTSAGLAQPSPEVFDEMLAKHPTSVYPSLPTEPSPPPAQVSKAAVARSLKSFPNGSAPGPSGLQANHLKEAVFCPSPDRANHAVPLFCLVRRRMVVCVQLPLGRCYVS